MIEDERVVITCAITGGAMRGAGNPHLPYTPEEYAAEVRRAADAGATVFHIHGRDPSTGAPTHKVEHFAAAVEAIRAVAPEVVLNISTGGSAPVAERFAPVTALRPEIASCMVGAANYAKLADADDPKQLTFERVLSASFADMIAMLECFDASGTAPEFECFDVGHLDNLALLSDLGGKTSSGHVAFVLGVPGALAADARHLAYMSPRLEGHRRWTTIVIDPAPWPVLAAAVALGGDIRVGFEDNAWLDGSTMAATNGELVERAVRLVRETGRDVADAATARRLVALPT